MSEYRSSLMNNFSQSAPNNSSTQNNLFNNSLPSTQNNLFRVSQTTFRKRNVEVTEYSLVATQDIPVGTFLGFYTGEFSQNVRESMYAAQLNHIHIYPFANEESITFRERELRPLANMNEPLKGKHANCCMIIQDFSHNEIQFQKLFKQEKKLFKYFRNTSL